MKFKTVADVVREQFDVPKGYDQLYVRSIEPGKTNEFGFEWPRTPGATLTADKADIRVANISGCPRRAGDGFCLATTHRGMASGVFSARTLLVVAVRDEDVLGSEMDGQKIRVRHAMVVACVNGSKLVRRFGNGMDLGWANLGGADLGGADLGDANLSGAYLRDADLCRADLGRADLHGVDLREANLSCADLRGADLGRADLGEADLCEANLHEANLSLAHLGEADIAWAKITEEQLQSANR